MEGEIAKRIKSGQRTAPMWSRAWLNYISKNGNGNSDPACQGSYILTAALGHDCSHTIHPLPESDFNPQRQEAVKNGGSSKPSVTSYSSAGLSESMDGRKRRREGWFDRDDRLMNGGEEKRNAKNRAAQKYGPNNAVCEPRCNCGRCVFNHLGSAGTHD